MKLEQLLLLKSLCKGVRNKMASKFSIHDAMQILPKLPVPDSQPRI